MKLDEAQVNLIEDNAKIILNSGIDVRDLVDASMAEIEKQLSKFGSLFGSEALIELLELMLLGAMENAELIDAAQRALVDSVRLQKDLAQL